MANCVKCGKPIAKGVKFCTSCGATISAGKRNAARRPARHPAAPAGQGAAVSTLVWIGRLLLPIIPIVGLIVYIVWAFGTGDLNRRNFARASLIIMIAGIVLSIVIGITSYALFGSYIKPLLGIFG